MNLKKIDLKKKRFYYEQFYDWRTIGRWWFLDLAMDDSASKSGVRTRKRNKSIKDSAKLVSVQNEIGVVFF